MLMWCVFFLKKNVCLIRNPHKRLGFWESGINGAEVGGMGATAHFCLVPP